MKKVLLAGLCGLSLMAACAFTVNADVVSTAGSGALIYVKV